MAHHVLDVTLEPRNYTTPGDVTDPPQGTSPITRRVRPPSRGPMTPPRRPLRMRWPARPAEHAAHEAVLGDEIVVELDEPVALARWAEQRGRVRHQSPPEYAVDGIPIADMGSPLTSTPPAAISRLRRPAPGSTPGSGPSARPCVSYPASMFRTRATIWSFSRGSLMATMRVIAASVLPETSSRPPVPRSAPFLPRK